jgi:predicted metal-dependent hydrolase
MNLSNIRNFLEKKTQLLQADDKKAEFSASLNGESVQKTVLGMKTPYSLKIRKRKYKDLI